MCWCNKNLRTPCCGGISCHPPQRSSISNNTEETVALKSMASKEILEKSNLALWTAYTDKKQEVEVLRDMLKECEVLLTQGTEEHCLSMAHTINRYFKEEKQ